VEKLRLVGAQLSPHPDPLPKGEGDAKMAKTTGFMEHTRALRVLRAATARASDWREFHGHMPEPLLR